MKIVQIFLVVLLIFWFSVSHAQEVSLNGQWDIVYDENNFGEKGVWQLDRNFSLLAKENIQVPSSWELYRKNYEGVAWYRKKFNVPEAYRGKTIRLQFDAVNYVAEVYLNDEVIGSHEGGYDPFEFTVDDLLKFDKENTLILRIVSPIVTNDSLEIDGMTKDEAPHWRGALTAGIWQDVRLAINDPIYVQSVFIEPFIDGRLKLNAEIISTHPDGQDVKIQYKIKEKGLDKIVWQKDEDRNLVPGNNEFSLDAEIESPKLWSPDSPKLYYLELIINNGEVFNEQFGVREISMKEDGFYLNEQKFYIKGAFWEGLYPNGLAMPDSPEMVRKEITLAKEAGFNLLRFWRRPPVPFILELADEMGIAIIAAPAHESMNLRPKPAPQMTMRVFHEISSMIKRDRNHPSIIMWELFNEIRMNELKRIKHPSALMARELDPTRIIIDESGGWADVPRAYMPYSKEGIIINEVHRYMKVPVTMAIYDDLLNIGHVDYDEKYRIMSRNFNNKITPEVVSVVSEIGYGGLPDLESNMKDFREKGNPFTPTFCSHEKLYSSLNKILEPSGLKDVFGNIQNLCMASQEVQAQGNKLQVEAVRLNPKLHGYCLHAFTSGDWVYGSEILDMWRNPKKAYYTSKEVNQPFYLSANVVPTNAYAGDKLTIKVNAVNEGLNRHGEVKITFKPYKGKSIFKQTITLKVASGITNVLEKSIELPQKAIGIYRLEVIFMEGNKEITSNSFDCHVFQKKGIKLAYPIVVIDPTNKIKPFLNKQGIRFNENLPIDEKVLIVTSCRDLNNANEVVLFREVFRKVKNGSKVILLDPPTKLGRFKIETGKVLVDSTKNMFYTEGVMPFNLVVRDAQGRWNSVNHGVTDHPYFNGLPVNNFMGQIYQNISADWTIIGLDQKPIVSSVSWDIKRDYWGILDCWWGSDLTKLSFGKGSIIVSTLNIIKNLDSDPIADRILLNMVEYEMNSF